MHEMPAQVGALWSRSRRGAVTRARAIGWSEAEVAARYAQLFRHTVAHARWLPGEAWRRPGLRAAQQLYRAAAA